MRSPARHSDQPITTGLRWLRYLGAAGLLASTAVGAAAHGAPKHDPYPGPAQGAVVAIGGALRADNEALWNRLIHLAGGQGAPFVVLGVASANPAASAQRVVGWLAQRGAVAESLPVTLTNPSAAADPAVLERVRQARGVFFTGGTQERIVNTLAPGGKATPLLGAIEELLRRGGVVAGTSAGAAVMSRIMFRDAPSVLRVLKGEVRDGEQLATGLGLVGPEVFIDQHFLKRGRFARLIPAMRAKGFGLGLGLDDNTAAVFQGGVVEIVGSETGPSGALFIDLREAHSDTTVAAFNLRNARLSYLEHGDRIDLRTGLVTPSTVKQGGQRLQDGYPGFQPAPMDTDFVADITGEQAVTNAMRTLIDSAQTELRGLAFEPAPRTDDAVASLGFVFRLYKGPDSVGWSTEALGPERFTVVNLRLDIVPVRMAQPLFTDWTAKSGR